MADTAKNTTETGTEEVKFTKKQLRNSKKFAQCKDIISVVLNDDENYTIEECEKLINSFLAKKCERKVK